MDKTLKIFIVEFMRIIMRTLRYPHSIKDKTLDDFLIGLGNPMSEKDQATTQATLTIRTIYLKNYTDEEVRSLLYLRAVEWSAWPAFISQLAVPILVIFYTWYYVLLIVYGIGIVWCLLRYQIALFILAFRVSQIVVWLKWPITLAVSIYLLLQGQYIAGFISLIYPFLSGIMGIPGKVGVIQSIFAKQIEAPLKLV
jgi:hypothetical protein